MSPRQVVLDTETTGLSAEDGHRIVEIGAIEIVNRRLTGRTLHLYLNPERDIDAGALAVHGLTRERLQSEPRFGDVAERILGFLEGAELLIHNAPFDVGFLDAELDRVQRQPLRAWVEGIVDTLAMARELHPGKRNSLDALCERYAVSNAHRTLHGALLDAELLADVYLSMTRGQDSLEIAMGEGGGAPGVLAGAAWPPAGLRIVTASPQEVAEHAATLEAIAREAKDGALWTRLEPAPGETRG